MTLEPTIRQVLGLGANGCGAAGGGEGMNTPSPGEATPSEPEQAATPVAARAASRAARTAILDDILDSLELDRGRFAEDAEELLIRPAPAFPTSLLTTHRDAHPTVK